ncbi:DedA family protein [Amycolatopsis sp.]|uniref:DedA family protein n=1 Tax=Amycolatopsis sp. TaxID=37632 RepID=UPI002CF6126F|nr:DedA family protein [Amycolatopsis sp.]HVV08807.1 DedA family protein [Amycolatopsis sp.]
MAVVTGILDWLQHLPQPALVGATGTLVFFECTIGLGFLAPGESGLLIAATTAHTVPRFLILWAVVTVCATAGDSIGYGIGRRWGPRLRETKLIQKYGIEGWDKATGVLQRRGVWAVFFARFLPVIRTLTPAAAGTSGLPFRKFLPAAFAGALCWSALHISIGVALGEAAKRIEGLINTGGLVVIAVLAAVGVCFFLRRRKKRAATPSANTPTSDPAGLGHARTRDR